MEPHGGKPVTPFNTPVGRNPEREPQARAGDRVEGSGGIPSKNSPGDEQESNRAVENRFEHPAAFLSGNAGLLRKIRLALITRQALT